MAEHDKVLRRFPDAQYFIFNLSCFNQFQQRFITGKIVCRVSEGEVKVFQFVWLILSGFCCLLNVVLMKTENKSSSPNAKPAEGEQPNGRGNRNDRNKWVSSLEHILELILKNEQYGQASLLLDELTDRLRESGVKIPRTVSTPYINTIPRENEPRYPGDREVERRIKSYVRGTHGDGCQANRLHPDIGGHISTYASSATLYEVALNHFFRGGDGDNHADMVYFQGIRRPAPMLALMSNGASTLPNCTTFARSSRRSVVFVLSAPYLMPDFWQFPSVSMGLAPIMSIYQARFVRYLQSRGLLSGTEPRVWCFPGDGEMDEPRLLEP
jgi:pyruvate dehydrogenase E1 component